MITLDVDYEAKEKSAIISNGWDDEAAKLLHILDADGEKEADEKESKDAEKDEVGLSLGWKGMPFDR